MLVLTRQTNESIMIGQDIEITVVGVRGDKVQLGIVAPSQVVVDRKEIYLEKLSKKQTSKMLDQNEFPT